MDCLTAERIRRNVLQPILTIRDRTLPISAVFPIEVENKTLFILTGDINGGVACHCAASQAKLWEINLSVGILGFCPCNNSNEVLVHTRNGQITKLVLCNPPQKVRVDICCAQYSYCVAKCHGHYMAVPSGKDNNSVDLWRLHPKQELLYREINSACEKHGGNNSTLKLLVGYDDGVLVGYEINADSVKEILRLKLLPQTITCLAYDEHQNVLTVGGPHADLVLIRRPFDEDYELIRTQMVNEGFSSVILSPSGKMLMSGGWDGKIRFFTLADLILRGLSNAHSDTILSMATIHYGAGLADFRRRHIRHHDLLVVGSQDTTITIWSLDIIESLINKGD